MSMSHCSGASMVAAPSDDAAKRLAVAVTASAMNFVASKVPALTAGSCDRNALNQWMQNGGAMQLMPCYQEKGCMQKSGNDQMCCSMGCTIPLVSAKFPDCAAMYQQVMSMSHCSSASMIAAPSDDAAKRLAVAVTASAMNFVASKVPALTAGPCDQNALNQWMQNDMD